MAWEDGWHCHMGWGFQAKCGFVAFTRPRLCHGRDVEEQATVQAGSRG